jgi:hypothetical protein
MIGKQADSTDVPEDDDSDEIDDNIADLNLSAKNSLPRRRQTVTSDSTTNQNNTANSEQLDDNLNKLFQSSRSKSMPPSTILIKKQANTTSTNLVPVKSMNTNVNTDRLKMAKEEAEKAIKVFYFLSYLKV